MPRLRRATAAGQNVLQQVLVQVTGPSSLQELRLSPCVTSAQIASSDLIAIVVNQTVAECRNILDTWEAAGAIRGVYSMPLSAKISRDLQGWDDLQSNLDAQKDAGEAISDRVVIMATLVLANPMYAASISREWEHAWPTCIMGTEVASSRKVRVLVARKDNCVANIAHFLATKEAVTWIERVLPASPKLKYAVSMVQGGYWKSWPRAAWSADLRGEGEIIGIGDTGLDYDNCFFRDPIQVSVPLCTAATVDLCPNYGQPGQLHRKIDAYRGRARRHICL